MKKILLPLAVLALAACNKEQAAPAIQNGQKAELTVSLVGTKATVADTENEAKINTLQVFVFNGDNIDAYGSSTSNTVTVSASQGSRDIVALVNAQSLATVSSKAVLLATASSLITDNTAASYVMVGQKTVTLAANNSIDMTVDRIAARVKISKITRAFAADGLKALDASKVSIIRYYLSNVVDNNNYGLDATPSTWYSSLLNDPASILTSNAFLYDKLATAATLAQDASYSTEHILYCYPNAATEDSDGAMFTRLVIEMSIDGKFYTYPIALGAIVNNRSYEIKELKITRLGNEGDGDDVIEGKEDEPIKAAAATFTVTVNDWEQVFITSDGQEEGVVVI